ncbi:MAG: hypothetical protein AB9866_23820 [Syntrophobacteraceae bacterium]
MNDRDQLMMDHMLGYLIQSGNFAAMSSDAAKVMVVAVHVAAFMDSDTSQEEMTSCDPELLLSQTGLSEAALSAALNELSYAEHIAILANEDQSLIFIALRRPSGLDEFIEKSLAGLAMEPESRH